MIFYLIILAISVFTFILAGYGVDSRIIVIDFILFLMGTYMTLRKDIRLKQYMSFNSIFLFSFCIVTYFYPMLVYNTSIDLRLWAGKYVDYNYMTLAVSLSTVGISTYLLCNKIAITYLTYHSLSTNKNLKKISCRSRVNILFFYLVSFLMLLNIYYLFKTSSIESITLDTNPFLTQFFIMLFIICLSSNTVNKLKSSEAGFDKFIYVNKEIIIPAAIIFISFLYVGDRGMPISMGLSVLAIYSFCCRQIRFRYIMILALIGFLLMFTIAIVRMPSNGALRNGDFLKIYQDVSTKLGDNSFLLMFSDLYGSFDTLCLSYEYHDKVGLFLPEYLIIVPFIFIPFFPTLLSNMLWGKNFVELSSGGIINKYLSTAIDSHMGGQIVADLFIRWDFIGVVVFMGVFGFLIAFFTHNKYKNIYTFSVFVCFVSQSLYLPRSSFFDLLRPIFLFAVWCYFFVKPKKIKEKIVRCQ